MEAHSGSDGRRQEERGGVGGEMERGQKGEGRQGGREEEEGERD